MRRVDRGTVIAARALDQKHLELRADASGKLPLNEQRKRPRTIPSRRMLPFAQTMGKIASAQIASN
jgi:hypothetical protein